MDFLPTLWFTAIAVLWAGYLFLEGFDLGVGMLLRGFARGESQRRVLINTIGPVWDGNEVWLITAVGATFAAFPAWYASLLSALYLPMLVVLLALIFRAVAFEYRGKAHTAWARQFWTWCLCAGSYTVAFGVGALLALTTTGLPLDERGNRVGGPWAWLVGPEGFNGYVLLGGLAAVGFCLAHALAFTTLKTDGPVRTRAGRVLKTALPLLALPLVALAVAVVLTHRGGQQPAAGWGLAAGALLLLGAAWVAARTGREGWAFVALGALLLASLAAMFGTAYPQVLPSTLNPAFSLTVFNASSTPYTLSIMSVVAAFGLPLVIAYQAWTYWVFRKRLTEQQIPQPHRVEAIL